jgi:DNA polymerase III sliding clamp (beta) subunit (PCNA family)
VLQGVCIALGDPVEMVGADGFRLAWQTIPIVLTAQDDTLKHLLIPTAAVQTLARVWKVMDKQPTMDAPGGSDPLKQDGSFRLAMSAVAKRMVTLKFTPAALSFHHGGVTILVQLTEGAFPNHHTLIPTDLPNKVSFEAEEAFRAVRSLAEVAVDGSGIVRLQWSGDRLVFSASAEEAGTISASVRAHIQGEEARIAFNIRYLLEYLHGKLGMVLLETSTPSSPGRFFSSGTPDVLVMPMFLSDPVAPTTEPAADQPAVGGPADPEASLEPADDQPASVDKGTPEEPAAVPSPPTRSKKPRRRIPDA